MVSPWSRAAELASKTPATRNRYVDFLRALSILIVIVGHWTAAAPYLDADGRLRPTHILAVADWTHWLTFGIQVMPVFFLVGGFSNGLTWRAAQRDGDPYAVWLAGRLKRLVWPVLPLLALWVVIGIAAPLGGVRPEMVRVGSQMALIPTWFLAVYIGVAALVPLSHALWVRFGHGSIVGFAAGAVLLDLAFFHGYPALGWANYLFVWSAVHQLGYAWSEGRLTSRPIALTMAVVGLATLLALTGFGPYPRAMVGVPGDAVSNTSPPKVTLLALAAFQAGLLLALQEPARRWLARRGPWTATVLVNGLIMTVYLWHLTAMVLWIGLAYALGGVEMHHAPGSAGWWSARPAWLATLGVMLVPFVLVFGRFERPRSAPGAPPAWRLVLGAALVVAGLARLALLGIGGEGWLGLRPELALPFAGAALIGIGGRHP
jgi:acyltransferase-like protein